MRRIRHRRRGAVFWGTAFFLLALLSWGLWGTEGGLTAMAAQEAGTVPEEGKQLYTGGDRENMVEYKVFFVDTEDANRAIFNPQSGEVPEGTIVKVSFPEQLVGSDGHIWKSLAESPQEFPVVQYGVHKYFIEYAQGEKVNMPESPEKKGEERLEQWCSSSWEADCAITGREPSGKRDPFLVSDRQEEQDRRIRNLVSVIDDSEWHSFYLIGKNLVPQTICLGESFDAVYSSSKMDRFSVGRDWYQVILVRVKRNWDPAVCTHRWSQTVRAESSCRFSGREEWRCVRCGETETARFAPLGHLDSSGDGVCERCGADLTESSSKEPETIYWKEGEAQIRFLGKKAYRFFCVDEDYRDGQELHRKGALFLCDSVIPANTDSDSTNEVLFSFGDNNNYKTSGVRRWLQEKSENSMVQTEPISIGVEYAYTGSTTAGSFEQLSESSLRARAIGYQKMTDRMFLLSLEEALNYREVLWRFGGETGNNPQTQLGPYSQGYYLRTPCDASAEDGSFCYGSRIYGVDLEQGNIHPVETDSETYGLRPAFVLPQG
ncbi:MAG: DUF6273 domain-containing protein [Clostridium sp.]|nr:DUF6273 domain-containing protein [Clostridium sp.]